MGKGTGKLTPRQESLALALALGGTRARWAQEHGLSYSATKRMAATPAFRALVAELQGEIISGAIGLLVADLARSVEVLKEIRDCKASGARARVSACRVLIDRLVHLREHASYESRLAEIEAKLFPPPGASRPDGPRLETPEADERWAHAELERKIDHLAAAQRNGDVDDAAEP